MKKILIVEDEKSLSNALKDKFSSRGFDVVSVDTGEKCLEYVEGNNTDFIVLDLVMPGMGGMKALNVLKQNENTKNIPVLVLTNLSDMEKISEAIKNGAFGYIIKSDSTLENIIEKVESMII